MNMSCLENPIPDQCKIVCIEIWQFFNKRCLNVGNFFWFPYIYIDNNSTWDDITWQHHLRTSLKMACSTWLTQSAAGEGMTDQRSYLDLIGAANLILQSTQRYCYVITCHNTGKQFICMILKFGALHFLSSINQTTYKFKRVNVINIQFCLTCFDHQFLIFIRVA